MKYRVFVSVTFVCIFLVFYTALEQNDLLPPSSRNTNTVLVVLKDLNNPFFKEMKNGIDQQARNFERTIKIQVEHGNSDTDWASQVNLIQQQLNANRLQALIITPVESPELVNILRTLNKRRIPIIVVDSALKKQMPYEGVDSEGKTANDDTVVRYTAFLASDNRAGGKKVAEYLRSRLLGDQKVVWIVKGPHSAETSQSRVSGFKENAYRSWIINDSLVGDWTQISANENTLEQLKSAETLPDAIFACNDEMALGVIDALDRYSSEKRPLVVGFDGTQEALRSIIGHKLSATVAQNPFDIGVEAVRLANSSISRVPTRAENIVPVELVRL